MAKRRNDARTAETGATVGYEADLWRMADALRGSMDAAEYLTLVAPGSEPSISSPSTAAGVLLGRTANGRGEWKDARGRSLKDMQEEEGEG